MSQTLRTYVAIGDFDVATRSFPVVASTRNPVKAPYVDEQGNNAQRLESLESWNLQRFTKLPIILAVHDQGNIKSIIGKASEIRETPRGLEMRITLASRYEEPATEEIERKLRGGLLRGVSVGFDYGTETKRGTIDGLPYSSFADNALSEVSLVPVPADEDALADTPETRAALEAATGQRGLGTIDPTDEAKRKAATSDAARTLAAARKATEQKLDAKDQDRVQHLHFDRVGDLGKVERTQVGGIRVPARLTRTGVLHYPQPDGSVSRQLRLPEEVFDAESLATLNDAPVTDLVHHRALISPNTFRDAALGHTRDARVAGKYVEATLVVNDADAADAIERGDLSDISCGYTCKHDHTPGTYDGEPYDLIHREIRYNHVAVLPPGRGRAGREVSIQLDSNEAVWCFDESENTMGTPNEQTKTFIKLDGKDYEYGSAAHIDKLESLHTSEVTKVRGELTSLRSQHEQLQGKFDAAEAEVGTAKKALEDVKKDDGEKLKSRIKSRVRLLMRAMRLFGDDDGEEDDEKKAEEKMDKFDGLSDRDIMIHCLKQTEAFKGATFDGKSDDYVTGIFEHALKTATPADNVDSVVNAHRRLIHSDANDPVIKQQRDRAREQEKDPPWKRPLQMSTQKG